MEAIKIWTTVSNRCSNLKSIRLSHVLSHSRGPHLPIRASVQSTSPNSNLVNSKRKWASSNNRQYYSKNSANTSICCSSSRRCSTSSTFQWSTTRKGRVQRQADLQMEWLALCPLDNLGWIRGPKCLTQLLCLGRSKMSYSRKMLWICASQTKLSNWAMGLSRHT